ncbi:MAG: GTP cyclohydrolase I FolE2 [Proteobacteria bacterium]|nr:GTP cyclohydrolase I FolE2 [Pseudomonadota bacterium]
MQDVQSRKADIALDIDRVGVKELRLPLKVRQRGEGMQHTVATVELSVDLPAAFKGTHMSRFVEALEHWSEELDYQTFKSLLTDVADRLTAERAWVRFRFPFFLNKPAPVTGSRALMDYQCSVTGEWTGEGLDFTLGVEVPVMTVCPCSKAISEEGAHSQRAMVRILAKFKGFLWIEDLVEIGESAGSARVYSLLKREDEKFVTEQAFANPCFVEDVVRAAAQRLTQHKQVTWFKVEVESFESIHNHSAFAVIERNLEKG